MKKLIIMLGLVLSIVVSLVSGTLATYTRTLSPIEGQVAAKQFYIGASQTMFPDIKLAPGEKNSWRFDVVNFKDNTVTEVDMDMSIVLSVEAIENKEPIDGLVVGLYENGNRLGTDIVRSGQAKFNVEKAFLASAKGTRSFEVRIEWKNGIVSDETDTKNMMNHNTSKISVTVTGTQCLHGNGEIPDQGNDNQSGNVQSSAKRLSDGRYEMTFENNGQDMPKGWLLEFSAENDSILSNAGSISVTKGTDTQWNTVVLSKTQNGGWQIVPVTGYQHNAISLLKGEKLTLRFSSGASSQELKINSASIKIPYDINGISAGFRYDGYNMYLDLNNRSAGSRVYGWSMEFKSDARLRTGALSAWTIEETGYDGQFYTYTVNTLSNTNDGRIFLNPNEKKEIMNTSTMTHSSQAVIKDVKFLGYEINFTVN
jgi:hypothetical protein